MESLKKVTFKNDEYYNDINKLSFNKDYETMKTYKDELIESFKNSDLNSDLYSNIFNQIDAFDNYHNQNIDPVDSDDEYEQYISKKEEDLYYESSEDEDYNNIDNYDNLDTYDIDDIDKREKFILGYKEYIIENKSNNDNQQIIDKSINDNQQIINKSNNDIDILDDILDKIDLDDNKLDNLINDIKKEDINEDDDVENIIDQDEINETNINKSYNEFKNRYNELCNKKSEPIIKKLFKILITNNPNKNIEFYINFVKSFITNDK